MIKFKKFLSLYNLLKDRINFILEIENIARTFENLAMQFLIL
jgi:hypothetical protein